MHALGLFKSSTNSLYIIDVTINIKQKIKLENYGHLENLMIYKGNTLFSKFYSYSLGGSISRQSW